MFAGGGGFARGAERLPGPSAITWITPSAPRRALTGCDRPGRGVMLTEGTSPATRAFPAHSTSIVAKAAAAGKSGWGQRNERIG